MTISDDDLKALEELDARLRIVLPEDYQESYEDVQPVSMGSASLKYADDGRVAWDEIWDTFCDLAMAGGPPHKGALLQPDPLTAIEAQPDRYREVVDEIRRGVMMVTGLRVGPSPVRGWVRVTCGSEVMAGWLIRAITMENVATRAEGVMLDLPSGPGFRVEKEIKNVITVIAKTWHYWLGHMPRAQKHAIDALFRRLDGVTPLVRPALSHDGKRAERDLPLFAAMAERIHQRTGLRSSHHSYAGWLGVECPSIHVAVWMMRAMVVNNVLSRREGTVLFVPVHPVVDPDGERVVETLARTHRLAVARRVA